MTMDIRDPEAKGVDDQPNQPGRLVVSSNSLQQQVTAEHAEEGDNDPSREVTQLTSRTPNATAPPKFSLLHEIAFVAIISSSQLLTQAGLAQSIAPLHVLARSFGVSEPKTLPWMTAAYSLTVGTFILIAGRWGDLYGHKLIFVVGYFWFAVWSLVAGFSVYSHSLIFFDVCRALQGIGPALLLPNGIAILSRTYPPGRRKEMILSIFGSTAPGGFLLGAIFSGIFAQLLWWPWIYWVMGMVCAAAGSLTMMILPTMPRFGEKPKHAELDILGSILGMAGLVLINFSWNQGPVVGWSTIYVYVILIIGFGFLIAFFYVEKSVADYPLLPLSSLSRNTYLVFGCIAAGWSSFGIWIYYLWQFLELERQQTILLSAAQIIPIALSGLCAAISTGFLISHIQPGYIMLASMTSFAVGLIVLATAPVKQVYWAQIFVTAIVMPWGMDMSFPSAVIIVSNTMPYEHQGLAASLVNTMVNYSISIGLGMAGTVEGHVNDNGTNLLKGYRGAWYLGISLASVGMAVAVCLALLWRETQNGKTQDQKVERGEEKTLAALNLSLPDSVEQH